MKQIRKTQPLGAGYTAIPHQLIENVLCKYTFTAYETRILWHIYRNTFGWHRLDFTTSHRKIAEATAMKLAHVGRTLKALEEKNIIARQKSKTEITIQFNLNYMNWKLKDPDGLFTGSSSGSSSGGSSSGGDGLVPQEVQIGSSRGTFPTEELSVIASITKGFWEKVGRK